MFDLRKTTRRMECAARLACVLMLVSACSSESDGAGPSSGTPDSGGDSATPGGECQPVEHTTEGKTVEQDAPGKSHQRHRFVGTSADGTRVAVLFSHFGPSSGAPFAILGIFELGKPTSIFSKGGFIFGGSSEDELASVEQQVLSDARPAFAEHGIVEGSPGKVSWCESNGSVLLVTSAPVRAKLTAREGICPLDQKSPWSTWSMCLSSPGGERCADAMMLKPEGATTCEKGSDTAYVDVVRVGDVLWFVTRTKYRGIDEDYMYAREVGAVRLSP